MREDLDWITRHALEKDRSQRYLSAAALADDLQRHLNHEPVSVGPPSPGYKLRKFYQRNKVVSIAAALALLSLILGGALATWQWREAIIARGQEVIARQLAETALHA